MIRKLRNIKLSPEKKTISTNFVSLTILQAANYILPLLTLPYLVRTLGVENFGLVMFAQALIVYFNLLTEFGFNMSATREISVNKKDISTVSEIFAGVFILKSILIILSFLLLLTVIFSFSKFSSHAEIYIYTFGLVLGQALFPTWLFQGMERMKFITILNVMAKLIFTVAIFLFVKNDSDYYMVPILNATGFMISGIIGLILGIKYFKIKFVMPPKSRLVSLFKDGGHIFISNLSVSLYTATNTIILGFFTNNAVVGVYASVEKLALAMKCLFIPLYQAIFPWLSQQPREKISSIIIRMAKYVGLVGAVMTISTMLFSQEILHIIFHNALLDEHHNILKIMSIIAFASGLSMLFNMLYIPAVKVYSARMKIMAIAGLYNISAVFVLTYLLGIIGTAIGVVSSEILLLGLGYYYFRKISHG